MILTYHGKACVKLSFGDLVIAFNPIGADADMKAPRFGADIALISSAGEEYSGADQMTYGEKVPFVARGPGEYETKDIFIRGFESVGPNGSVNTMYLLKVDDMSVGHLGALANPEISQAALEAFADLDILLLPVFDQELLSHELAYKLATRLNPKVVVPLFAKNEKTSELKAFLKEAGEEAVQTLDKYTVKRKDIADSEGTVVVIQSF